MKSLETILNNKDLVQIIKKASKVEYSTDSYDLTSIVVKYAGIEMSLVPGFSTKRKKVYPNFELGVTYNGQPVDIVDLDYEDMSYLYYYAAWKFNIDSVPVPYSKGLVAPIKLLRG